MKAGDLAREENDTATITTSHVENGRHDLERGRIEEGVSGLTQHGHLVLYSLLTLDLENETPIRSRDVRPRYTRFAQRAGRDPLVPRRMRDHLSELAMLGLVSVTERNEGRRGGTYREYTLEMDIQLIISALDDIITDVGVHDSLIGHLPDSEGDTIQ